MHLKFGLLIVLLALMTTRSANALRCLVCSGNTCGDLIYRVGTTTVECDDNSKWCQKFVFSNGLIHRACADPGLSECITNSTVATTGDFNSVNQYCCDYDLCNSAEKKQQFLNFYLLSILSTLIAFYVSYRSS